MILQRIRIIVVDAGFEPGTSASEVWSATNEPPHLIVLAVATMPPAPLQECTDGCLAVQAGGEAAQPPQRGHHLQSQHRVSAGRGHLGYVGTRKSLVSATTQTEL